MHNPCKGRNEISTRVSQFGKQSQITIRLAPYQVNGMASSVARRNDPQTNSFDNMRKIFGRRGSKNSLNSEFLFSAFDHVVGSQSNDAPIIAMTIAYDCEKHDHFRCCDFSFIQDVKGFILK
jgi:hypothetical protein